MKHEQLEVEFDPTIGVEAEEITKEEVEVEKELTKEEASKIEALIAKLTDKMKAAGINIKDKAAVMAYVIQHMKEAGEKALEETKEPKEEKPKKPAFEVNAELAGDMHDAFVTHLKEKVTAYTDGNINIGLMVFRKVSPEHLAFVLEVQRVFKNDPKKYGQYFRDVLEIKGTSMAILKTTAYVTSDTFRATGDVIETGITALARLVNQYGFHVVAKGIDKLVGGRPEALEDHNYVKEAVWGVWEKLKPEPKKEKKKAEKKAELDI